MKKLLFFIPTLDHGGAEKVLVNLLNNIDPDKYNITLLTLFGGGVNRQYLKPHIKNGYCIKKQFPGNSKLLMLFSPKRLYSHFIKEDYDIVVSYLEGPTARIVSGCDKENVRLVSWIHCLMNTPKSGAVGFRSFSEAKRCYNCFDNTVCVSKGVMESFRKTFDFKKPLTVLYNTIETDVILEKAEETVSDIEFDEGVYKICSVGRLTGVKGFDRLAHIHKRLLEDGVRNKVYLLGIGEEEAALRRYIDENKLGDSFCLLGYKTNPYKYVKGCDLYVCSSLSEGFSTSVTESLVVGTPVVTTLCPGMYELLGENGEYGIVTENNENALYEGIKRVLTTPGLLESYAEKAAARGRSFSTEKTVRAVEEMIDSL